MKVGNLRLKNIGSEHFWKNSWKAMVVLLTGLILTSVTTSRTKKNVEEIANQDFEFFCNEIKTKIETRLHQHAQLLRSGKSFFAASDSVTFEEWQLYNNNEEISKNLPGIQGIGYAQIIQPSLLEQHIRFMRRKFPGYTLSPEGDRQIYTSIIYLEPFSGRNLRAFGYDMFSESTRRKAMEISRDSGYAMLSGKVILVQETEEDVQVGTLMYIPVYKNGAGINSVQERRRAIKGWVYSPYRMNDLMKEILGNWDLPSKNRIRLKIYDQGEISETNLLYDSQGKETAKNVKHNLSLVSPVDFNGYRWTLHFTGYNRNLSMFGGEVLTILISGITISLLLFALSLGLINSKIHTVQIQKLNKELEKLNTDKDRFLSILGHDLRTPFCAVLGLSDLLKNSIKEFNKERIKEVAGYINESVQNTYQLLDDLLLWARAESGKIPFEPQTLHFTKICSSIVRILSPGAINKNITIQYPAQSEIEVFADMNMLKTILRNLISNAIKFCNKDGKIDIMALEYPDNITIKVKDNGIGISRKDLSKLFDIAQFHSNTGTAGETGTGFGLLICKEFVEKHGGTIWVESEPEFGSLFGFTLPKYKSQNKR